MGCFWYPVTILLTAEIHLLDVVGSRLILDLCNVRMAIQ